MSLTIRIVIYYVAYGFVSFFQYTVTNDRMKAGVEWSTESRKRKRGEWRWKIRNKEEARISIVGSNLVD